MRGILNRIGGGLRSLRAPGQLQPAVILLSASVLLTIYRYYGSVEFFDKHIAHLFRGTDLASLYGPAYLFFSCFLWMFVVPALLIKLVLKKKVSQFGAQLGDTKTGFAVVGILYPLIVLILLWPASRQAAFRAEYPLFGEAGATLALFLAYELAYGVYYLGWEFFFRGFMLFGLRERFGAVNSILIMTIRTPWIARRFIMCWKMK